MNGVYDFPRKKLRVDRGGYEKHGRGTQFATTVPAIPEDSQVLTQAGTNFLSRIPSRRFAPNVSAGEIIETSICDDTGPRPMDVDEGAFLVGAASGTRVETCPIPSIGGTFLPSEDDRTNMRTSCDEKKQRLGASHAAYPFKPSVDYRDFVPDDKIRCNRGAKREVEYLPGPSSSLKGAIAAARREALQSSIDA